MLRLELLRLRDERHAAGQVGARSTRKLCDRVRPRPTFWASLLTVVQAKWGAAGSHTTVRETGES